MVELTFHVDWGYQFVYSRRHYHPEYVWDGRIECENGMVESVVALEYPYTWWGPVHSPREIPLPGNEWESKTRRRIAGIKVKAICEPGSQFRLLTAQGTFTFSSEQLMHDRRIIFPVGWKYSHCTVIITCEGHLWYRSQPRADEIVVEAREFTGAPVLNWSRMEQVWIDAGRSAAFEIRIPPRSGADEPYWLFHLQGMAAITRDDPYALARGYMPYELKTGDQTILLSRYLMRYHDAAEQILHDVWAEIPAEALPEERHTLEIINRHDEFALLVHRITFRPGIRRHLELQVPRWGVVGRELVVSLRCLKPCTCLQIDFDNEVLNLVTTSRGNWEAGLHELRFLPVAPAVGTRIAVSDGQRHQDAVIEALYDIPMETPEVKIGYDMTTVPHDNTGAMDHILDYTHRTQLGNLVCFRPFPMGWPVDAELLKQWAGYCRRHLIYIQGINVDPAPLASGGEEYFHAAGRHELSWVTYLSDPDNKSDSMKEAAERYVSFVRTEVVQTRAECPRVSFGDASGGHRYSLMAGADFLRAETMVANTMHHLSQARAAAQSLGSGEWGVHIAIQHPKQPYLESHLGQYYLSLMQAWMMGASFLYEEDSLFVMFKEERQCWDDALTKGKREMTREFYRFAATHPRRCGPETGIAVLLGRYASPFNGFICGCDQDPDYSVWGQFGRDDPQWGHRQPEKAQQILDVLMPGASTHPLRQRYDRRRFFFSGTPYGDFDQAPIEATAEFLSRYKLILHLGWSTMIGEDYRKLKDYVTSGGILLLGIPQLSTHEKRDFLQTMQNLALFNEGKVSDLCGVEITGAGERYCGHWTATGPEFQAARCPGLSRAPSRFPDEDGPSLLADVELHGAEPVIVDAISGKPLLTRFRLGCGQVYLITMWAYAGHEELADFSAAVVSHLCEQHCGDFRVNDPYQEVFWTRHPDRLPNCGRLFLLNTDWTVRGNAKTVLISTPSIRFKADVTERRAGIITYLPFGVIEQLGTEPHVEIIHADEEKTEVRIHAVGQHEFRLVGERELAVTSVDTDPCVEGTHLKINHARTTCSTYIITRG